MEINNVCGICGLEESKGEELENKLDKITKDKKCNSYLSWYDNWKSDCAESLIKNLFNREASSLLCYFEKAKYCTHCLQNIRDLDFIWRKVKLLTRQLASVKKKIRQRVHSNYTRIQDKSDEEYVKTQLSLLTKEVDLIENYSPKDILQMIYCGMVSSEKHSITKTTVGRQGLNNLSGENFVDEIKREIVNSNSNRDENAFETESFNAEMDYPLMCLQVEATIKQESENDGNLDGDIILSSNRDSGKDDLECTENDRIPRRRKRKAALKTISYYDENSEDLDQNDESEYEGEFETRVINKQNTELKFRCQFCDVSYRKEEELQFHMSSSHKGKDPYTCAFCETVCANFTTLKLHTKICRSKSSSKKLIKCDDCGDFFRRTRDLKRHLKKAHNVCDICEETLSSQDDLKAHLAAHKSESIEDRTCKMCGKVFKLKKNCIRHLKSHEDRPFHCEICNKYFKCENDLLRHNVIKSHGQNKVSKLPSPDNNIVFGLNYCVTCNKSFSDNRYLNNHLMIHEDPSLQFECPTCSKAFTSQEFLDIHLKTHVDSFSCDICGKMFSKRKYVNIHKRCVHRDDKDKPHQCDICGKGFSYIKDYRTHKTRHERRDNLVPQKFANLKSPFKWFCKFCGQGYIEESDLNTHYSSSHQGPNPFSCAFCTEVFSNSSTLRTHRKKIHPSPHEAKKYQCHICDKTYANNDVLKEHIKLHGDPSLLMHCPHCGKMFANKRDYALHLETHNTEVTFVCDTCGKGFTHSERYKIHIRRHTQEKSVKCSICDKGFVNLGDCKRHEKTHTHKFQKLCQ